MQNVAYDWTTALSGESVTITRKRDGATRHLQGEEAANFDYAQDKISDTANGSGEPYYIRAINALCAPYFGGAE